jgi:hypothetical protein
LANAPSPLSTSWVSGYDFGAPEPAGGWIGTGESFGWTKHLGSDIGTKAGQPIVAPFAGTATFQTGLVGYGNLLTEKFSNGWEFLFGHVAGGVSGPVQQGQQIGETGANVGSAQGAVTLFAVHDPQGNAVNPDSYLNSLVAGRATGASLFGAAGAALDAAPKSSDPCAGLSGAEWIACKLGSAAGSGAGVVTNPSSALPNLGPDPFGIAAAGGAFAGSIAAIPTQIGHGLADFFVVGEHDIAQWLGSQAVAFFVAAIVLLVLFL